MSHALALGDSGHSVTKLIHDLNRAGATRLPLLSGSDFTLSTMARVMEFQFNEKVPVDGVAGSSTLTRLQKRISRAHKDVTPDGLAIVINLIPEHQHQWLTAFADGEPVPGLTRLACHGGSVQAPSRRGVFPMTDRRLLHHTSDLFPEPQDNMACALFYSRSEAIHQGPPDKPSHGCIHVGVGWANKLFVWAGSSDVLVIVLGQHAKVGRGHNLSPELDHQIEMLKADLSTRL